MEAGVVERRRDTGGSVAGLEVAGYLEVVCQGLHTSSVAGTEAEQVSSKGCSSSKAAMDVEEHTSFLLTVWAHLWSPTLLLGLLLPE